jgi:hypothetical protein
VTLILGVSKAEGIYMSTDYRVTDGRSGRLIDDASIKFLTVHYPGEPKALLAYTGLAILPDGTPTGTWIRETLRGESEVIDQSMAHLQSRLDRDIAHLGMPLMVNVLVLEGERRLFGGFSNVKKDASKGLVLNKSFGYVMQELEEPFMFANGSGATRVIADQHLEKIRTQLSVRPRKPLDHMGLLASVNRRVAAKDRYVSPFCSVSFINSDDRTGPVSHTFVEGGETVPFEMPMILFGIDLSGMWRRFYADSTAVFRGEAEAISDVDPAVVNEELKRRP